MCIRDRDSNCGSELSGGEVIFDRFRDTGTIHGGYIAGAAAVSYTHLRAHETVLDLVCRLLLEKKKNNNFASIVRLNCHPLSCDIT